MLSHTRGMTLWESVSCLPVAVSVGGVPKSPIVLMWPVQTDGFKVRVHVELVDGVPRCVGFDVRGFDGETGDEKHPPRPLRGKAALKEITTVGLRSLSVPRLMAEATQYLGEVSQTIDRGELAEVRRTLRESPGRRYGAEHFERVAQIYTAHIGSGAPTQAVAHEFGISRTAAAKQVAKCRELGLLAPTRQGRAGGGKKVKR